MDKEKRIEQRPKDKRWAPIEEPPREKRFTEVKSEPEEERSSWRSRRRKK